METPPEQDPKQLLRQKLKAKLREKIGEKSIGRCTNRAKKEILFSQLKKVGVDVEEFKKNMDILSQAGAKKHFEATLTRS